MGEVIGRVAHMVGDQGDAPCDQVVDLHLHAEVGLLESRQSMDQKAFRSAGKVCRLADQLLQLEHLPGVTQDSFPGLREAQPDPLVAGEQPHAQVYLKPLDYQSATRQAT